jgi:hypothetical protein
MQLMIGDDDKIKTLKLPSLEVCGMGVDQSFCEMKTC